MKRRRFFQATLGVGALGIGVFFAKLDAAEAKAPLDYPPPLPTYSPELFAKAEAEGRVIFLDFSASWCPTCRAQGRAIDAIRGTNSDYDLKITFFRVDWDEWGAGELSQRLAIPRRSTLVVLKGSKEIGRIVADTDVGAIQALMDQALVAAG